MTAVEHVAVAVAAATGVTVIAIVQLVWLLSLFRRRPRRRRY